MAEKLEEVLTRLNGGVEKILGDQESIKTELKKYTEGTVEFTNRMKSVEDRVKDMEKRTVSLPGLEDKKEMEKFSLSRAILMTGSKDWANPLFAYEREVHLEAQKRLNRPYKLRDMQTTTDTLGGFIVPTQYVAQWIALLRARLVVEALGARVMSGLTGSPVEIPRQTGGATWNWVGEGATITASDQAIGQLVLTPHEGAAMTRLSNRLLRMATPGIDAFIRDDLVAVAQRGMDQAWLRGVGAANEPLGIANTAGINTTAIAGVPDVDDLYAMLLEIEYDNADEGKIGWAMNPRTWNTLRQLKDGNGNYILSTQPYPGNVVGQEMGKAGGGMLVGYPFRKTTLIERNLGAGANRSRMILGNWDDFIIGIWAGMEIKASDVADDTFLRDQTLVRIIVDVDAGLRHVESFCVDNTFEA